MSVSQKSSHMNIHRLLVHRRPLHPELFKMQDRRTERHGDYEVESWLLAGGHVVRFSLKGHNLTETVSEEADHLPEAGLVYALPCLGEKDYELESPEGQIHYVTTLQTETLTDNLYNSTLHEMQDFARETGSLAHEWTDRDSGPCLSVLDGQKYRREYHFQSYHMIHHMGLVLRTQSIFEII